MKGLELKDPNMDSVPSKQSSQNQKSNQKRYVIADFSTVDELNQPMVVAHQLLAKNGYLCAVHCRAASEYFVAIGGFRNMYPLVTKILNSNIASIGNTKPGILFSQLFKILATLFV